MLGALAFDPRPGPWLTRALVAEDFEFYGRTLTGAQQLRDRWKRGVSLVENLMGDAVGKLYVQRHFPPDAKSRIDTLVDNLQEAYRISISELDWMTPQTRQRALAKLNKFTAKVGYPIKWRDYSKLAIDRDDLYGNVQRGYAVNHDREPAAFRPGRPRRVVHDTTNRQRLLQPGDERNRLPRSDLQPPFFDPQADEAANYGGSGR